MASLIPGYNYDIFISYRQKDNKHDGWVTEFVNNLKGELESTFKEEISVYFDINPHDGLLETHDVDASLKEKLKCLVFIPIISRTYCDPKSFAWEHEFKAFVEQASQDKFGLKVKLPGGNVASRVLPVRIHDLDSADIMLCEYILDGVLRGVEFIYKEPGVNRPLTPYDDENKNFNKTRYRNQINKVALAINELLQGLETEPEWQKFEKRIGHESFRQAEEIWENEKIEVKEKPAKSAKWKLLSAVAVVAILIIASILTYPKIFKRNTLEKLRSSGERISVAVMPFQNMTNDTTWNVWQDGIQELLVTALGNTEELRIRQTESVNSNIQGMGLTNYASLTPSIASKISQKIGANVFIYGNVIQSRSIIRVNTQLIDSKTEDVFKTFQIDGTAEKVIPIVDSLSREIRNFLIITKLEEEVFKDYQKYASTNSPEAYKYFIFGQNAYRESDNVTAIKLLSQAVTVDSNFTFAITLLSSAYRNLGLYQDAKKWCLLAYKKRDLMPMQQKIYTNWIYAMIFETPYEELKYLRQLQLIDDQLPHTYFSLGRAYQRLHQYDKSIPVMEKSLEIYKKQGSKPRWAPNYIFLGISYHETGQFKKEKILYKRAEQDFPNNLGIISRQSILSLTEGDTVTANRFVDKYISLCKESSASDAVITTNLAEIYSEADILDKAEKYYRQALSLEPEIPVRINNLAWFLIDKDRNINEGMELVDKALKLSPDNYSYLDCKGWGLYKQGQYQEALDILQKSWDLRMKNAEYNHAAFLHLEAAKKVVAGQKNN
jgi:tetratricopeptide (TPR) repeat protein